MKGFSVEHIESMGLLPNDLMAFNALVLYFHSEHISDSALNYFEQYISTGGGVLAIHSATASFMGSSCYMDIIGGRFKDHGPISTFEVIPVPKSKIFTPIQPFLIKDELYIHDLKPGIRPHFIAMDEHEQVPLVWTRSYGRGRVCYASPGHQAETMRHPHYQRLLQQGLKWVSEGSAQTETE